MFWARLGLSIADAAFWILIIGAIGLVGYLVTIRIIDHLLEDIPEKKEEEE